MLQPATVENPEGRVVASDKPQVVDAAMLSKVLALLDTFQRERTTMPLQLARTFVIVALKEGLGVEDYGEIAGVSQSVATRHLLDLGLVSRRTNRETGEREPGLGLITSRPDGQDLRKHRHYLTPKGKALLYRLQTVMDSK